MKSKEQQELQELLRKLLQSFYSICSKGLAKNRFEPEKRLYFRRKIRGFEYDNDGTHITSWEPEKLLKPAWYEAITVIEQETKKLNIYDEISTIICSTYGMEKASLDYYLSKLIDVVAWKILEGEIADKSSLAPYVLSFLKDINHEEQGYKVIAQIQGVILQPEAIQLDENTLLRKPTREDIETERHAESPFSEEPIFYTPTAIIELTGTTLSNSIPWKVEVPIKINNTVALTLSVREDLGIFDAIAILRLFRVGGVEFIKWDTHIDSVPPSTHTSAKRIYILKSGSYLVRNKDVETLKTFWANMKRVKLPESAHHFPRKEPDELSIAYDRYCDSLDVGIIEKRISSAVMGLEALYLGEDPQDRGELRYKLGMRVGKLLSLIGYSPSEAKQKTRAAYDIRSTYVHGGILKGKNRQEYEKKYGDLNEFCKTIIDYLRASTVARLLRKTSKTSLIDKIDDSFLDIKKEEEISELLFMPYEKETPKCQALK